jgi:hypothetical protein
MLTYILRNRMEGKFGSITKLIFGPAYRMLYSPGLVYIVLWCWLKLEFRVDWNKGLDLRIFSCFVSEKY